MSMAAAKRRKKKRPLAEIVRGSSIAISQQLISVSIVGLEHCESLYERQVFKTD